MFRKRDYIWKALVWVMIPFTLAASAPQMHCPCAEAQGLRFCECCYRNVRLKSLDEQPPKRSCCKQQHEEQAGSQTACESCNSGNSAATQVSDGKSRNCCIWSSAVLSAPGQSASPPTPCDVVVWGMPPCCDVQPTLVSFAQHDSALTLLPQLDRLSVFQHLVI